MLASTVYTKEEIYSTKPRASVRLIICQFFTSFCYKYTNSRINQKN